VPSVQRALTILELIAMQRQALTLSEIGERLGIPLSTLHGLASTLVNLHYLEREAPSKAYRLGPKIGALAGAYEQGLDLVVLARGAMDRLRDATGEATSLTVLDGTEILFIDKRPARGRFQVINPVGTRLPAHATGAGKVMLAYLSPADVARRYPGPGLPALTARTITTTEALRRSLGRVRAAGCAFDDGESEVGLWAVAGCIRDAAGRPAGAINIVAPRFRVDAPKRSAWSRLVVEAAAEVSGAFGFRPEGTKPGA
jgi:DNA-binding IclR family transcriptional regulator